MTTVIRGVTQPSPLFRSEREHQPTEAGARPAVSPPSAMNSAPVEKLDSSLARNTIRFEISSQRPTRRSATCCCGVVDARGHRRGDSTGMNGVAAHVVDAEVERDRFRQAADAELRGGVAGQLAVAL